MYIMVKVKLFLYLTKKHTVKSAVKRIGEVKV